MKIRDILNLRRGSKEVLYGRVIKENILGRVLVLTPSGAIVSVPSTRFTGTENSLVFNIEGRQNKFVALPYGQRRFVNQTTNIPAPTVLPSRPAEPSWWLYSFYSPTSPDYPFLRWMTTNPEKTASDGGIIEVATPEDFLNIKNNPTGKYIQVADIDFGGAVIEPADTGSTYFEGYYNGNGYKLKNFKLANRDNLGLFGRMVGARIENVIIDNAEVQNSSDYSETGMLAGNCSDCTIKRCAVWNSTITASGAPIGGLISTGDNCTIEDCYVKCTISVDEEWVSFVAGAVGVFDGTIRRCWVNVQVPLAPYGMWVAGLVGSLSDVSTVEECCAFVDIDTGNTGWWVAGLIGEAYGGNIRDCFTRGSTNGDYYAGGFVGQLDDGTVENCYSAVDVSGQNDSGAFVGYYCGGNIIACYYDETLTDLDDSYASPEMRKGLAPSGWDFENTWDVR